MQDTGMQFVDPEGPAFAQVALPVHLLGPDRLAAHHFLFRFAGRMPDAELARMRTQLADGLLFDLARVLDEVVGSGRTALTENEFTVVRALLLEAELDPEPAGRAGRIEALEPAPYTFARHRDPAESNPQDDALPLSVLDTADQLVAEAAAGIGEVIALWRVYRTSADGTVERVYLAETLRSADVVETVAELQYVLTELGENPPRVEVFREFDELTPYHEAALGSAVLVWTEQLVPARLARVFDGVNAGGPFFEPDHPRLEGAEREQVLAYLRGGVAVLDTPGMMDDVVEPDRVASVPVGFRSDGDWIWTDAVTHYLERYHLAPEPELTASALAATILSGSLNRFDHHRIRTALFAPVPAGETTDAG
jgi:hypothetical protein